MSSSMCAICPKRDSANVQRSLARLNASLGNEKESQECERLASEIESSPCPWWWTRTEKLYDKEGRDLGESRTESLCGIVYLPRFFMSQGNLVQEALETSQSKRNQQADDMKDLKETIDLGLQVIAHNCSRWIKGSLIGVNASSLIDTVADHPGLESGLQPRLEGKLEDVDGRNGSNHV